MSNHSRIPRPETKTDTTSSNTTQTSQMNPNSEIGNIMNLQRLIGNQAVIQLMAQRQLDQTGNLNDVDSNTVQRYALSSGDASNLVEEKYATGDLTDGINFSTFSSCIGIVGQKGGKMVGAHLVRVGADDSSPDVDAVVSALSGIENGMMFGFLGNWESEIKGGIASGLGIYDWREKETQSGWKVSWQDDDWVLEST